MGINHDRVKMKESVCWQSESGGDQRRTSTSQQMAEGESATQASVVVCPCRSTSKKASNFWGLLSVEIWTCPPTSESIGPPDMGRDMGSQLGGGSYGKNKR